MGERRCRRGVRPPTTDSSKRLGKVLAASSSGRPLLASWALAAALNKLLAGKEPGPCGGRSSRPGGPLPSGAAPKGTEGRLLLLWLVKALVGGAASKLEGLEARRCPEGPCSEEAEECRDRCGEGSALPADEETEERLVGAGEPAALACDPRGMERPLQGLPS